MIDAYGYIDDDDNGKEVKQEKILTKDPNSNQLTVTDLKEILTVMITLVKEVKTQYPDQQTDVIHHHDNRLEHIKFQIQFKNNNNTIHNLDEESFFKEAATHESLSELILGYCKVTDDGEEGTRIYISHEYDEGSPAGTYAILALVNQDKKWISSYIDFLRTNDLDHEVEQMWHIRAVIDKYQWSEDTCRLAIARNISCCGQSGRQQFNDFIAEGLENYLEKEGNKKMFIDNILKEFQEWDAVEFRLKDGSKKYYINYIVSRVKHFEKVLTEEEINKIEIVLLDRWDMFQKN